MLCSVKGGLGLSLGGFIYRQVIQKLTMMPMRILMRPDVVFYAKYHESG
jgi:hypothetical protein